MQRKLRMYGSTRRYDFTRLGGASKSSESSSSITADARSVWSAVGFDLRGVDFLPVFCLGLVGVGGLDALSGLAAAGFDFDLGRGLVCVTSAPAAAANRFSLSASDEVGVTATGAGAAGAAGGAVVGVAAPISSSSGSISGRVGTTGFG